MYALEDAYGRYVPICGAVFHREPSLLKSALETGRFPGIELRQVSLAENKPEPIPDMSHCDSVSEYLGGGYNLD